MNKYAEFVRARLNERDLLEQLAEECCELGKAALKLIRAMHMSKNLTPTSEDDAAANLREEIMDVLAVLYLMETPDLEPIVGDYWKWERWAKRLGYEETG